MIIVQALFLLEHPYFLVYIMFFNAPLFGSS